MTKVFQDPISIHNLQNNVAQREIKLYSTGTTKLLHGISLNLLMSIPKTHLCKQKGEHPNYSLQSILQ